jgi:hypothetical protein
MKTNHGQNYNMAGDLPSKPYRTQAIEKNCIIVITAGQKKIIFSKPDKKGTKSFVCQFLME